MLRCSTALLAKCADETEVELFGRKTGHNKSTPTARSDSNCEGLGSHRGFGLLDGLRDGMGHDQRLYKENVRPSQVKSGLLESPGLINDHIVFSTKRGSKIYEIQRFTYFYHTAL